VSAGGRADTFGSAGLYSPSGGECKAFRRQFTDPVDLIARSGAPVDRWRQAGGPDRPGRSVAGLPQGAV